MRSIVSFSPAVSLYATNRLPSQAYVWLLSFLGALLLCMIGVTSFGIYSLTAWVVLPPRKSPPKVETEVIVVSPMVEIAKVPIVAIPPAEVAKNNPSFARTSEDQASAPPKKNEFIGERDTTATSDALAVASAPEQISQKGRLPRVNEEIETTESRLQDGALDRKDIASPMAPPSAPSLPSPPMPPLEPISPEISAEKPVEKPLDQAEIGKEQEKMEANAIKPTPPSQGDTIVERTKPQESPKPKISESQKHQDPTRPAAKTSLPTELPKPSTNKPGFHGNQQKNLLSGSISRNGKSALNVSKTALGKYHSSLSRAIEAQWHRNCTKYRDFITPGTITVRFVIDPKGGIRSASVIDMVDAGEIQKGFTLNSIRQAEVPAIPAELQKELDGEPLELLYNFYF